MALGYVLVCCFPLLNGLQYLFLLRKIVKKYMYIATKMPQLKLPSILFPVTPLLTVLSEGQKKITIQYIFERFTYRGTFLKSLTVPLFANFDEIYYSTARLRALSLLVENQKAKCSTR